jgi:ribosomal protein L32
MCGRKLRDSWKFCPDCGTDKGEQLVQIWECPKCHTCFEHDGKAHLAGILCPECRTRGYQIVGVLQPVMVKAKDLLDEEDTVSSAVQVSLPASLL